METEKFGDKKDHMKWTVLLDFAQKRCVKRIFQVAMWTDPNPPCQKLDDAASIVANFFHRHNDLRRVEDLGKPLGIDIQVWCPPFPGENREGYFNRLIDQEIRPSEVQTIWFLDPDTGIEPCSGAKKQHVSRSELHRVFKAVTPGDFLAVFQYSQQQTDDKWRETNRDRFRRACGIPLNEMDRVRVLECPAASKAAIILAVQKLGN